MFALRLSKHFHYSIVAIRFVFPKHELNIIRKFFGDENLYNFVELLYELLQQIVSTTYISSVYTYNITVKHSGWFEVSGGQLS